MQSPDLISAILVRLVKSWRVIAIAGILIALLFAGYAKLQRPVYTAKATLFPLTSTAENALSGNTLSGLLGLADVPKSFSNEAAINIIDLTLSRYVREAVALTRLPAFNNNQVATLLVEDYNQHRSWSSREILLAKDSTQLAVQGGELLKTGIVAKMSKNGVMELYFSHANPELITPISNALIDIVSQFYIDLKIKKASADYEFTVRKIDSLDLVLAGIDRKAIRMQNTTLFAPDRLEYEIPKDRINADKQRYVRQRDISLNNQEEALWRLQKLTPIISVLDQPTAPFTVQKPSLLIYGLAGLLIGLMVASLWMVRKLLYQFVQWEFNQLITGSAAANPGK